MRVFACGTCGGALEVDEKQAIIKCTYCGYTNDVASLEKDFEEFKDEVKSWLTNLGAVGGSGMDVIMRQIYLRDNIYPTLCTEFSNLIGDTEDILDYPLAYLPMFSKMPDLSVRTGWSQTQGKPMKEFARKLDSPELLAFASDPESIRLIHELRLRALITPTLMDVVSLSNSPNPANFRHISKSLDYIASQIKPLIDLKADDEPAKESQTYYRLLSERFEMTAEALSKYAESLESRSPMEERWCEGVTERTEKMRETLRGTKHLSVIDRVLLDAGLENDRGALAAGYNLVSQYLNITDAPYEKYIEAVSRFTERTLFQSPSGERVDLSWFAYSINVEKLSWFLSSLNNAINEKSVIIMAEQPEVDAWVKRAKKPQRFYLYPFYLLRVKAILKSGFLLWKKGDEESFYSLCDGCFNLYDGFHKGDFPSLMTPGFKKMVGSNRETLIDSMFKKGACSVPANWRILPPTTTPANVIRLYTEAHNLLEEAEFSKKEGVSVTIPSSYSSRGFDAGKVKALTPEVLGLVYLPMVIEQGKSLVMGKHLGLDENLSHRMNLLSAMEVFLTEAGPV